MKTKILIFITVVSVVSLLFVIPSFADENASLSADEDFFDGEWYFLEYNPDPSLEFPITAGGYYSRDAFDIIVFSKDLSRIYNVSHINYFTQPNTLSINYNRYGSSDFEEWGITISPSEYYFLIKYDYSGVQRIPLESVFDVIDSPFKFTPELYTTYRFRNATSLYGLSPSLQGLGGVYDYVGDSSQYNPLVFQGIFTDYNYDIDNDTFVPSHTNSFGVAPLDPAYQPGSFTPSSSYHIAFTSGNPSSHLGMLYYYLDIPLVDSSYTPPPALDLPEESLPSDRLDIYDTLSQFQPVVKFIVDVFNGLDELEIFPGFSVLDVCFAYVSIYIIRFFLKLVAGG